MKCDLHVHSVYSDGSFSIGEILDLAKHIGLDCIAITDHDTVAGVAEAIAYGKEIGVKVIPAIELSADSAVPVHILGYNIDYTNPQLRIILDGLLDKRRVRKDKILEKLAAYKIVLDDSQLPTQNVGRSHIAKALRDQGFVNSIGEAFDRYLGQHRLAYFPAERLSPLEAVNIIKDFGGYSVIAHPINLHRTHKLDLMIQGLKPYGLSGLECYYPSHSTADQDALLDVARHNGLFATGGSDFHGVYKGQGNMLGIATCTLPKELY